MRPPAFWRKCFSLAELMVAIGILGIGLLMVAAAFPVAIDQVRQAVELQTSRMVFDEAVNKLKTQITSSELDRYVDGTAGAGNAYRMETGPLPIFLLSFDEIDDVSGGQNNFFSALENNDCVYSGDDTYGWSAAVQRIGNRCYKFWVFVLREPRGMEVIDGGQEKLKFQLIPDAAQPYPTTGPPPTTSRLNFAPNAPPRGTHFLADNGHVYRITETTVGSAIVMCDQDVRNDTTGIISINSTVAYPARNPDITSSVTVRQTRLAPTIAVYQTVITY